MIISISNYYYNIYNKINANDRTRSFQVEAI